MGSAEISAEIAAFPPRERILAASRELFAARGIRGVGVDEIASAAQTNKTTLYRHFESKDLLVVEYLRALAAEADAAWQDSERRLAGDPLAQLHAWIDFVCALLANPGARGCPLANAAVELPQKDHPGRVVIEEHKTQQRQNIQRRCREAGFAEPERLADEIFLLLEGARIDVQSTGLCGPGSRLKAMLRVRIDAHPRVAQ